MSKAIVTRLRLEFLAATVERELERIDADCGARPSYGTEGYSFAAQDAWWKKRKQAIEESRQRLEVEGARFTHRGADQYAIQLAGIRSSSASGYTGAYRNWLRAARARLQEGKA